GGGGGGGGRGGGGRGRRRLRQRGVHKREAEKNGDEQAGESNEPRTRRFLELHGLAPVHRWMCGFKAPPDRSRRCGCEPHGRARRRKSCRPRSARFWRRR